MASVSVLDVLLYGEPIGTLTLLPGDRSIFAFSEDYIEDGNRPVLGLGLKDEFGQLVTDFRTYGPRVMPYFSNLLPEGHLRECLAERAKVNPEREFFLLWALGSDLPGAITVRPADGEEWPPIASDDADDRRKDDREDTALRFSLAGVQLKFSALAPAYDLVYTVAYMPDETAALNFSRTKRFDEFTEDELAHMANRASMPESLVLTSARETVELFHQYWNSEKSSLPLHDTVIKAVEKHCKKVPLALK